MMLPKTILDSYSKRTKRQSIVHLSAAYNHTFVILVKSFEEGFIKHVARNRMLVMDLKDL